MGLLDVISVLSLFVGLVSIVLAIYTMISSNRSEERSKENFHKTQEMVREFYDRTKELLNEIDKRSNAIETVVTSSQEQLLSTITTIVNETVIPKKEDTSEKMTMLFLQQLIQNPKGAAEMMTALQPIIELSENQQVNPKRKKHQNK